MTWDELTSDVFSCMHCDRFGLPFNRIGSGKFYRFPPTIGATGPVPLLFVGINPRISTSNRSLHEAIVNNWTSFEALRRNRFRSDQYIGYRGLEKHYALHVKVASALFPTKSFETVACVTDR